MSGVDQFNSVDQMNKCYEKAQKHVSLFKIMLPVAIVLEVLTFASMELDGSSLSILSEIVNCIWLFGIVAFYSINGTWKYIGKFMAKPWHWHFGLFFMIKILVCAVFYAAAGIVAILCPIVPYLYGIYLDKKTISNAEAIAYQLQYQYADPNYNQYANQYYGQYQPADNTQYI